MCNKGDLRVALVFCHAFPSAIFPTLSLEKALLFALNIHIEVAVS